MFDVKYGSGSVVVCHHKFFATQCMVLILQSEYDTPHGVWYDAIQVIPGHHIHTYPSQWSFVREFVDGAWVVSPYMITGRTLWRVVCVIDNAGNLVAVP